MDRAELIKELDELAEMTPPICLWDSPETVEVGGGEVTVYCKPFEQFQSLVKQAADALRGQETVTNRNGLKPMHQKNCDTCGNYDLPICSACTRKYDEPPTKWVPNEQYKPMTNADRIRAMTDEELAGVLNRAKFCKESCGNTGACSVDTCRERFMNWLQQPVKEGADHV